MIHIVIFALKMGVTHGFVVYFMSCTSQLACKYLSKHARGNENNVRLIIILS